MHFTYNAKEISEYLTQLPDSDSKLLKKKFVERFCDKDLYREYEHRPGYYILWSCMPGGEIRTIEEIASDPPFIGEVFLFWDYHDIDDEMWKLGREHLFKLSFEEFIRTYRYFPQDTYVFNTELKHAVVLSHDHFHIEEQLLCLYG